MTNRILEGGRGIDRQVIIVQRLGKLQRAEYSLGEGRDRAEEQRFDCQRDARCGGDGGGIRNGRRWCDGGS